MACTAYHGRISFMTNQSEQPIHCHLKDIKSWYYNFASVFRLDSICCVVYCWCFFLYLSFCFFFASHTQKSADAIHGVAISWRRMDGWGPPRRHLAAAADNITFFTALRCTHARAPLLCLVVCLIALIYYECTTTTSTLAHPTYLSFCVYFLRSEINSAHFKLLSSGY